MLKLLTSDNQWSNRKLDINGGGMINIFTRKKVEQSDGFENMSKKVQESKTVDEMVDIIDCYINSVITKNKAKGSLWCRRLNNE